MNITRQPVSATIIFGLVCGVCFIPFNMFLNYFVHWPVAFRLTIWIFLALYGILLARWEKAGIIPVAFPLLLMLIFAFLGTSNAAFLFLALGVLSWIRSGICFPGTLHKMSGIGAELLICFGGGALVAYFSPHSRVSWAMGIWMFFLVQSLFFVFIGGHGETENKSQADPFEHAKTQAEKILSG
ncbi:MAG: hypothetical protein GY749_39830 [Desulfobacteraceae bacterium]|nr:hypothetical protein [Desulfobacteraceae bacterium]